MNRHTRRFWMCGTRVCVLLAMGASSAVAQSPENERNAANELDTVEVVGIRSSLATAQGIKREKIEIVDSIVASDINKLPDFSTTDALSRVTGIQIARDRGEGGDVGGVPGASGVSIRGLTQMETLLNGREVFSAGWGRTLDFADIPAEMLAGIDVYKTSSAEHIEGGVGGTVDLRTRRPFDFAGREIAASARVIHGDLVKKEQAQFSTLLSDRWQTSGGEFGALLSLAYQKRGWREDQKSAGAPVARAGIVAGQTVIAPNGITESVSLGSRERAAANMVLEWMPAESLSLYAEANYAEFLTVQDTYQLTASLPGVPTFTAGSPVLFPGSSDIQRITWTNAAATTVGTARDTLDRTAQVAVGGEWTGAALTLKGDLSYTKGHNSLVYSAIPLGGATVTLTQDLSGGVPSSSVAGTTLTSLAGFTTAGIWYAYRPFDGDLTAASFDGEYQLDGSFVQTLSAGLRLAQRHATDAPGQIGFFPATVPAAGAAGIAIANPYANFIVGNPAVARSVTGSCAALAVPCAIPARNDLGTWNIDEQTQSGYAMAKFGVARFDGNAGLRVVRTRESVSGYQTAPGGVAPIRIGDTYNDVLPSMNLRYEVGSGLYLRGAASKTITRQDFNQLSPSLTLNPVLLIGSSGNPSLKPVRADNFDLAVEKYFNPSTFVHATGFWKRVDGFLTTVSAPETYAGVTYQVSRPRNSNAANIKGAEFGYQQFYDFLPGWMSGLGLQANYTYVDSGMNNALLGQNVPLQNLSKHSYNVVGMYEKEKVSVRVAYNWRDRFLSGVANVVGIGALPVYTAAYGWLDASVTWRFDKELSIALEGTNLLRTVRRSYYGVETRPQSTWANDRQLGVTMTAKF
ncbi:MAG TPA: TonB-dependent receptor [Gallionella sp.]|nr:TonB-dependent receptor [Gallionella sp.]